MHRYAREKSNVTGNYALLSGSISMAITFFDRGRRETYNPIKFARPGPYTRDYIQHLFFNVSRVVSVISHDRKQEFREVSSRVSSRFSLVFSPN